eukprot:CAMPEP_0114115254 /NCGR_PEP_ID=MMETSP0043_2-20121206/3873_1 /TAXON_ID=464988 /ORGANISM="Hemiselmis andersenii, Strain CCMP644" /LENGTH=327 /DNA_ID=CAMNT_0001207509 /DNA_START=58 /DNA_END=1038 /DNA_ORIENTATION=+
MSDNGEEGEGEEAQPPEEEAPKKPRFSYCVALVAGEGVKLNALVDALGGGSVAGMAPLPLATILSAEDDAATLEEITALGLEEGALPPPGLISRQLKAVLDRPWPEEVPAAPEGDAPGKEMMSVEGGPRLFHVCADLPLSEETVNSSVPGGFPDLVVLVTRPPRPVSTGEEGEPAATPDPQGEEAIAAAKAAEEEKAKGVARVQFYQKLIDMATEPPPVGTDLMADVAFGEVSWVDEEQTAEAASQLAKLVHVMVQGKVDYKQWAEEVAVVDSQPPERPADRRHYDRVLSSVPASCLSVPMILHALIEQTVQACLPGGGAEPFSATA